MTSKTKTQLTADLAANFPDNTTGAITAAIYRTFITDVLDSLLSNMDLTTVTDNTTISNDAEDGVVYLFKGSSPAVITLPANTVRVGFFVVVHRNGEQVSIAPPGTDTINNAASAKVISKNHTSFIVVHSGSGNWFAAPFVNNVDDLVNGRIAMYDDNGMPSASSIREASDRMIFDKDAEFPPNSILVGLMALLSQNGPQIYFTSAITGKRYVTAFQELTSTGSENAWVRDQEAQDTLIYQSDDSMTISLASQKTFRVTVQAQSQDATPVQFDAVQVNGFTFRCPINSALSNFRMRIRSVTTGNPIYFYPSRLAWETGEGGLDRPASGTAPVEHTVDISDAPMAFLATQQVDVDVVASVGDILGNSSDVAYFSINRQLFNQDDLITQKTGANDIVDVSLSGSTLTFTRRNGTTFTRTLPAPGAFLHATNVPTGVVGGVWTRTSFDGTHFVADNTVTQLDAGASTVFGADSFFAITNNNTVNLTFDISDVTTASFTGVESGQTMTIAPGTCVLFFHDVGGIAPIANYNTATGVSPMEEGYPDIPFSGAVRMEESDPGIYNSYLGRTATNAGLTTNQYIAMPDLHISNRPSWVVPGNVFVMRHTGQQGANRIAFRADNTGDSIATHGVIAWLNPGETLAIQAPAIGVRTWQLFPVSQRSDGSTYYDPEMAEESHFYIDDAGAVASDNSARLHHRRDIVDGNVRDHIRSASATNNPVSMILQRYDLQDDIAWASLFSAWGAAVPPLGTTVGEVEQNIGIALAYVTNNVTNGYDFDISDPLVTDSIQYVTFQSGQTLKIGLSIALAAHIAVLDVINISGNSFAGNNGDWAITNIYPDRLAIDITVPSASSANNTGASGLLVRPLYGRIVFIDSDLRQVNFDLYKNSARNNPVTVFHSEWFDISTDPVPTGSVINLGYNNDVVTTGSILAVQDRSGDFYSVLGGPRGSVHYLDNTDPDYENTRYLPTNFEDIHIRTSGTCDFYMDIVPADLPVGRRLRYSIFSDEANDDDDVEIFIGRAGSGNTFNSDEGLIGFSLRNGVRQEFEIYNTGDENGWRLVSPFSRRVPSAVDTSVVTASAGSLPISVSEIIALENEDPNRRFISFNEADDRFILRGAFDYELQYSVAYRFEGAEDTGLSFVTIELVPKLTRAGTTTTLAGAVGNVLGCLFFIRNGSSSDPDTMPPMILNARVRHQAQPGDEVGFDVVFGTFPSGYTINDIKRFRKYYAGQVTGGIK